MTLPDASMLLRFMGVTMTGVPPCWRVSATKRLRSALYVVKAPALPLFLHVVVAILNEKVIARFHDA